MGLVLQSERPLVTCEVSSKPVWGGGIEIAEGNGVSGWEEVVGVHVDDSSGRFGCEGKVKNRELEMGSRLEGRLFFREGSYVDT